MKLTGTWILSGKPLPILKRYDLNPYEYAWLLLLGGANAVCVGF